MTNLSIIPQIIKINSRLNLNFKQSRNIKSYISYIIMIETVEFNSANYYLYFFNLARRFLEASLLVARSHAQTSGAAHNGS